MKKYILKNFSKIIKDETSVTFYDYTNNKEFKLVGDNVKKYLLNNINKLKEYISIDDLNENTHLDMYEKDKLRGFLDKLVDKGILIENFENYTMLNKHICIIDLNPSNAMLSVFQTITEIFGISISYFIPKKNNLNNKLKELYDIKIIENFEILNDIDLYVLIDYRFNNYEMIFSELNNKIIESKKPIIYATVSDDFSIVGPLVTTATDVSYVDREDDLMIMGSEYIKHREINYNVNPLNMLKIYNEILNEIYYFYNKDFSTSSLIDEYLIINNKNSTVVRRCICSFGR